jgi:hypothetical protein
MFWDEENAMFGDMVDKRIHRRLLKWKRLAVHLIFTFVIAIGLTIAIEGGNLSRDFEFVIPAAVLLFIPHALWVSYGEMRNFIVRQEYERTGLSVDDTDEKPKHGSRLMLDDDGELVEYIDIEDEKSKYREEA